MGWGENAGGGTDKRGGEKDLDYQRRTERDITGLQEWVLKQREKINKMVMLVSEAGRSLHRY